MEQILFICGRKVDFIFFLIRFMEDMVVTEWCGIGVGLGNYWMIYGVSYLYLLYVEYRVDIVRSKCGTLNDEIWSQK